MIKILSAGIIYKAENKRNGRLYIGQTTRPLLKRIDHHLKNGDSYFPRALRLYGVDAFKFSVIDTARTNGALDKKEKYWIAFYGSMTPFGYNLTEGGGGTAGWKIPDEIREKLKQAKKDHPMSATGRESVRQSRLGKHLSEESKEKLRVANTGRTHIVSDATRKKISERHKGNQYWLGKHHSEETKQRMSASQKGRVITPEARQKLREANLGKKASKEARQKMSVGQLKRNLLRRQYQDQHGLFS